MKRMLSIFVFSLGAVLFICSFSPISFRWNLSSSLPEKLFLSSLSQPPFAKNTIVAIDHPYLNASIGKKIIGVAGDRIAIHNQTLFINDTQIGQIKTTSDSEKIYHPISEGEIPEGSYFVYTSHLDSFDSRYEEFGLIREEWIKEVLWPVF